MVRGRALIDFFTYSKKIPSHVTLPFVAAERATHAVNVTHIYYPRRDSCVENRCRDAGWFLFRLIGSANTVSRERRAIFRTRLNPRDMSDGRDLLTIFRSGSQKRTSILLTGTVYTYVLFFRRYRRYWPELSEGNASGQRVAPSFIVKRIQQSIRRFAYPQWKHVRVYWRSRVYRTRRRIKKTVRSLRLDYYGKIVRVLKSATNEAYKRFRFVVTVATRAFYESFYGRRSRTNSD